MLVVVAGQVEHAVDDHEGQLARGLDAQLLGLPRHLGEADDDVAELPLHPVRQRIGAVHGEAQDIRRPVVAAVLGVQRLHARLVHEVHAEGAVEPEVGQDEVHHPRHVASVDPGPGSALEREVDSHRYWVGAVSADAGAGAPPRSCSARSL